MSTPKYVECSEVRRCNEDELRGVLRNVSRELMERVNTFRELLNASESTVRYLLVDPLLKALGWDPENPCRVLVQPLLKGVSAKEGKLEPDYVLLHKGEVKAFVEVKSLKHEEGDLERVLESKKKYGDTGVGILIITNGVNWYLYDLLKRGIPLKGRLELKWSVSGEIDNAIVISNPLILREEALKRLKHRIEGVEGVPAEKLIEEYGYIKEVCIGEVKQEGVAEERAMKLIKERRIEGPLTIKLARVLVLWVLAGAEKPLSRKEIVKKVGEKVILTKQDLEKTKSGLPRWEARVRWRVTELKNKGLIKSLGRNRWIITEKGRSYLKGVAEH